jgi:hypothetical protein
MKLQYMTLISNGDRGVGYAQGSWDDDGSLSSTSTPNPSSIEKFHPPGKPAVKLSIADYQKLKTTGVKPSPRTATATPEAQSKNEVVDLKSTHGRNTSGVSANTHTVGRVPSLEKAERRQNGTAGVAEKKSASKEEKYVNPLYILLGCLTIPYQISSPSFGSLRLKRQCQAS